MVHRKHTCTAAFVTRNYQPCNSNKPIPVDCCSKGMTMTPPTWHWQKKNTCTKQLPQQARNTPPQASTIHMSKQQTSSMMLTLTPQQPIPDIVQCNYTHYRTKTGVPAYTTNCTPQHSSEVTSHQELQELQTGHQELHSCWSLLTVA